MTNFIAAIIIGLVLGVAGGLVLRSRQPAALWQAPVLALVGSLIAAGRGAAFGHAGYGWKKATLQVVLALGGVGVAVLLARRAPAPAATDKPAT